MIQALGVDLDRNAYVVCGLFAPEFGLERGKFKFRDLSHENNRRGEIINVCLNILATTMSSREREKDAKRG